MLHITKQKNGKFTLKCVLKDPVTSVKEEYFSGENIDETLLGNFLKKSGIPRAEALYALWQLKYLGNPVTFNDNDQLEGLVIQ